MEPAVIQETDIACERGFKKVIFAKDQPEYNPLPALTDGESVITKWKLTDADIKKIFDTREIYIKVLTFGSPLQPILVTTNAGEI